MLGVVVNDATQIKRIKDGLGSLLDKRRKIYKHGEAMVIPTCCSDASDLPSFVQSACQTIEIGTSGPNRGLKVPNRWTIYPPMVLFTSDSLPELETIPEEKLRQSLSSQFGRKDLTHMAVNNPIPEHDIVRKPGIIPLVGDFGPEPSLRAIEHPTLDDFDQAFWCHAVQNGIHQVWAPRYTMFSRGNVKEKKRVLEEFDKQNKVKETTIADLYAGIGYFVFSYAAQNPRRIFCWELNPWSVEGLRRGALLNKWNCRVVSHNEVYTPKDDDFIVVFQESNQHSLWRLATRPENISHINMGLLPDCKLAWPVALDLSNSRTVLHVHENVHENDIDQWRQLTAQSLSAEPLHVEKIKTFSPQVWHVCGDFQR